MNKILVLPALLLVVLSVAVPAFSEPGLPIELRSLADDGDIFRKYQQIEESLPETLVGLTQVQREALFKQVSQHPVTDLNAIGKYDPNGYIGFCFGRAMGVHLMARKMGLHRESIRKLFIVGDLRSGPDPEWRFHVTTLVKGTDGKWWAVDPIMTWPVSNGRPLLVHQWMETVQRVWDKPRKAKFYITESATVMPDVTKDPDGTTGEHIIELGFEPLSFEGFKVEKYNGREVFRMDVEAEETFMLTARETGNDRFNFSGLEIKGNEISYRDYFRDLMTDLTEHSKARAIALAAARSSSLESTPSTVTVRNRCANDFRVLSGQPKNLHSLRLHKLFGNGGGR